MKKLIIVALAVVCTTTMQAASVFWGGAVATPDGVGYLPEGTRAALLYSAVAFTGDATKLDNWVVGGTSDNGGAIVGLYTMGAADAVNGSFSATYSIDGSVDGYYAVLILNEAGDLASFYVIDAITGTTGASAPTDRLVNASWTGPEYLTSGGYTVNVPEPTSGLLLLFGVAGLALKRKRD